MKLTNNCYAVLGLGYSPPWVVNAGFIIETEKTLIIDTGGSYLSAQTIYGYAKNVKPENELIVVNTEKHFDHIGGNSFFNENGIKIFGHRLNQRSKEEFQNEISYFNQIIDNKKRKEAHEEETFFKNTKIVNVDIFVNDGDKILLGRNSEAEIIFTPGHTESNISVYYEKDKVLYCGDLIVNGYIPNLEASNSDGWKQWIESINKISHLDIEFLVPGHGYIITKEYLETNLKRIKTILSKAIQENKPPTQ